MTDTLKPKPEPKSWHGATDPRSKKIVVRFRPGSRPGILSGLNSPETYFRHNLSPIAGWLILSDGEQFSEKTATVMLPSSAIAGVEIVDPAPEDECWQCLRPRSEHDTVVMLDQKMSSPVKAQHLFDWTPVSPGRRRHLELVEKFPSVDDGAQIREEQKP